MIHNPPPRRPIRVLIVDDEPLARDSVRVLLACDPEVEIVGECGNGRDALESIQLLDPDLVFLDIEMPGLGGFEVLAALSEEEMPRVIFLTAYNKYAVRAFEINALDYVLKPFDDDRFRNALDRAKTDLLAPSPRDSYRAELLELLRNDPAFVRPGHILERIAIREAGRIYLVDVDEIDWIGGAGNLAELHTGGRTHFHREPLASLEARLDPTRFSRIHRSTIVRIDRVQELRPRAHGDYDVILKDGTPLVLSRRYRDGLKRLIGD